MAMSCRSGSERGKGLRSQRDLEPTPGEKHLNWLWHSELNGEERQGQPEEGPSCPRNQLEATQGSRKWVQSQVTELVGRKRHPEETVLNSQQSGRLSETEPKRNGLSFKARVGAEFVLIHFFLCSL